MELAKLKEAITGEWKSISTEIRPSAARNEQGELKPFYLRRQFRYDQTDQFSLTVTSFADPFGKVALFAMDLEGHIIWQGPHPIADGAQKVRFIADQQYFLTPMVQGFTEVLKKLAQDDFQPWETGKGQSILNKPFIPFGLQKDQIFEEYDLIYYFGDLLFWGARNIDGRGFDTEANRPTNLQIPLMRLG